MDSDITRTYYLLTMYSQGELRNIWILLGILDGEVLPPKCARPSKPVSRRLSQYSGTVLAQLCQVATSMSWVVDQFER
jgi:hypothetical protein